MRTFSEIPGQDASQPSSPVQLTVFANASPEGAEQVPPPPTDNELSEMETGEEDSRDGFESTFSRSNEAAKPQHEMDNSVTENEAKCTAMIERNKMILLQGLSMTSAEGNLTLINLSRRGLIRNDAKLLKRAMQACPHLSVLKLSYNNLGDAGAAIIATGFVVSGGHHKNLSVVDLGFNGIGDDGCAALSLHAVAGNHALRVLYLSGNRIGERGALSLSGAMLHGCSLTSLHISANRIGAIGVQAIARAVAENEACQNSQAGQLNAPATDSASIGQIEKHTMQELYLGEISMETNAFVPIPSMLLTNLSLRVLCLSNTRIDDQSMALLAQALSRNKNVPLESVQLSFNEITCAGVECFMNAVWGSKTLRELKLDNNKIRDRGAQLSAVALTAINFEVLDLGFNRITNVGIKALMKNMSETTSLKSLSLAGIPLDATACKAVSYALAYNTSLREFYVDNCQVGYSGQRHIVAGIVSNRWSMLRVITGFDIGAIAVTLQLPQVIETWSNEKVLRFMRLMWQEWNKCEGITKPPSPSRNEQDSNEGATSKQNGPAAPATVVRAAKKGLALIGNDLDSSLHTEPYEREISQTSPVVPANATMLERTLSGTIRVPPLVESHRNLVQDSCINTVASSAPTVTVHSKAAGISLDPIRENRNLEWLRAHFRSLNEVSHLPFNSADLWQLHQYFYSPILPPEGAQRDSPPTSDAFSSLLSSYGEGPSADEASITMSSQSSKMKRSRTPQSSPMPMTASKRPSLDRNISFQMLGEAVLSTGSSMNLDSMHSKRRSTHSDNDEESIHASKRARNNKPRIAHYPRIREKLEGLGAKPSQEQILSLLRLLKFVESVIFAGSNPLITTEIIRDPEQPSPEDVEMIILDLL
jgi:Ran GTPase-activating protein (RanGAP) involved in mRNA processing and transport